MAITDQRSQNSQHSSHQQMSQKGGEPTSTRSNNNRMPIDFKNMNSVMGGGSAQINHQNSHHGSQQSNISNKRGAGNPLILDKASSSGSGADVRHQDSHQSQRHPIAVENLQQYIQDQKQMSQTQHSQGGVSNQAAPLSNTRLKVEINSSTSDPRRGALNSQSNHGGGGNPSVHTPLSQMSGYSQPLAPQNNRFSGQQQQQQHQVMLSPQH